MTQQFHSQVYTLKKVKTYVHTKHVDFSITVIQNVNKTQVKIRAKKDNVAGNFSTLLNSWQRKDNIFKSTHLYSKILMAQLIFCS